MPNELVLESLRETIVVQFQTVDHIGLFGCAQELRGVGVVVKHPERSDGDDDCGDSLEDKNPPLRRGWRSGP